MSESWLKKMWSLALRRKSVDAMSGGKPFTRCGTLMVYAGEFKLILELIPESKPARRSMPPDKIECCISVLSRPPAIDPKLPFVEGRSRPKADLAANGGNGLPFIRDNFRRS